MSQPRRGGLPLFEARLKAEGRKVPKKVCRECGKPCPGRRRSWCSDLCVTRFRLRTDQGFQRGQVLRRDQGVCAECGRDCQALARELAPLRPVPFSTQRLLLDDPTRAIEWTWASYLPALDTVRQAATAYRALGFPKDKNGWWPHLRRRSWWDMDHRVPLWRGGTNDLANLQTLCLPCHAAATAAGATDRAAFKASGSPPEHD